MQVKSIAECSKGHSAKLSTFIKLPFAIKIFVLPFYTGFTVVFKIVIFLLIKAYVKVWSIKIAS